MIDDATGEDTVTLCITHYEFFCLTFLKKCIVSVFTLTELDSKLQSAEARCKILEKQLNYMRKMVENAKKERNIPTENQVVLKTIK